MKACIQPSANCREARALTKRAQSVGEEIAKLLAAHFSSVQAMLAADWEALIAEKEKVQKENALP